MNLPPPLSGTGYAGLFNKWNNSQQYRDIEQGRGRVRARDIGRDVWRVCKYASNNSESSTLKCLSQFHKLFANEQSTC